LTCGRLNNIIKTKIRIPSIGIGGFDMNISFDENTKKALLENLEKENKSSVRLMIKGIG
jgi:hypothetical protein